MYGNKEIFAIQINRYSGFYEMFLYIEEKNILEFFYKNMQCTYRWHMISNISDWFEKNLIHIIDDDEFPFEAKGDSAAELCKNYFEENADELINDMDRFEIFQNWTFRHSWFLERAGVYLPEVYFRQYRDKIEISWNSSETFKDEGVEFKYKYGNYYIDKNIFLDVIKKLIEYKNVM